MESFDACSFTERRSLKTLESEDFGELSLSISITLVIYHSNTISLKYNITQVQYHSNTTKHTQPIQVLRTNIALGYGYLPYFTTIYREMLNVCKLYSQHIKICVGKFGRNALSEPIVRFMRVAKREALQLIELFIKKSKSTHASFVAEMCLPPLLDPVYWQITTARFPWLEILTYFHWWQRWWTNSRSTWHHMFRLWWNPHFSSHLKCSREISRTFPTFDTRSSDCSNQSWHIVSHLYLRHLPSVVWL